MVVIPLLSPSSRSLRPMAAIRHRIQRALAVGGIRATRKGLPFRDALRNPIPDPARREVRRLGRRRRFSQSPSRLSHQQNRSSRKRPPTCASQSSPVRLPSIARPSGDFGVTTCTVPPESACHRRAGQQTGSAGLSPPRRPGAQPARRAFAELVQRHRPHLAESVRSSSIDGLPARNVRLLESPRILVVLGLGLLVRGAPRAQPGGRARGVSRLPSRCPTSSSLSDLFRRQAGHRCHFYRTSRKSITMSFSSIPTMSDSQTDQQLQPSLRHRVHPRGRRASAHAPNRSPSEAIPTPAHLVIYPGARSRRDRAHPSGDRSQSAPPRRAEAPRQEARQSADVPRRASSPKRR